MPKAKRPSMLTLRRANVKYRTTIADKMENATNAAKIRLRKQRNAHFKALERNPFFKKLLSKKIPFQVHSPTGPKNYTLLGIGFKGEGNFRRTVLLIDDKGRTLFFGEQMRGIRTIWEPYRILKEKIAFLNQQKFYEYNELESWSDEQKNEVSEATYHIKKNLNKVTFQETDIEQMREIKKFM